MTKDWFTPTDGHHLATPGVPISSYEHTSTAQRTSGNRCVGATIGGVGRWSAIKQTRKFNMSNANLKTSNTNQSHSNQNLSHQQNGKEQTDTGTSSDIVPSGFQAIATAYGDYAKKSFEDTKSFAEKLSGAKSFDKVIEVQAEFAKTTYETFVTESQKIGALYGDLAKQSYKPPFSGLVAMMTPTNR